MGQCLLDVGGTRFHVGIKFRVFLCLFSIKVSVLVCVVWTDTKIYANWCEPKTYSCECNFKNYVNQCEPAENIMWTGVNRRGKLCESVRTVVRTNWKSGLCLLIGHWYTFFKNNFYSYYSYYINMALWLSQLLLPFFFFERSIFLDKIGLNSFFFVDTVQFLLGKVSMV